MLDEPINTKNKLTEGIRPNSSAVPANNFLARNYRLLLAIALVIIIGLLVGMLVLYHRQQIKIKALQDQAKQLSSDPNVAAQAKIDELVAQVGKLIVLPTDEQPTVATVTDLSKLKDQPFFANAQVGDKVLIYPKAGKAILYRPSTNKIIELAPFSSGSSNAPAPTTP